MATSTTPVQANTRYAIRRKLMDESSSSGISQCQMLVKEHHPSLEVSVDTSHLIA